MIFGFVILITALTLSIVAAFYSISGLVAIFAAAPVPIMIMGGALEIAKVVTTVFLHNNWKRLGLLYKAYLVPAVAILMFLTSIGIFGLLSKAHSDQNLISGDVQSKIAIYDEKIKISRDNIDANRRALKQMDEAVDQVMSRSTSEGGADKAVAIRRNQVKERDRLLKEIGQDQKKITDINTERAPIAAEVRKVEADVGPIRYIAALIYGDNPDANLLERAVRWVIILIVVVFDPLALCLILASNKQFEWALCGQGGWVHDASAKESIAQEVTSTIPEKIKDADYEADNGPLTTEQLNQLRLLVQNSKDQLVESSKPSITESAKTIADVGIVAPIAEAIAQTKSLLELHPYLTVKVTNPHPIGIEPMGPMVSPIKRDSIDVSTVSQAADRVLDADLVLRDDSNIDIRSHLTGVPLQKKIMVAREAWDPRQGDVTHHAVMIPAEELLQENEEIADTSNLDNIPAHFGTSFSAAPETGELFLRVDYLPTKLFKFNGTEWTEIEKSLSDTHSYNAEYINYLIEQIKNGVYDPDDLSDAEREQIEEYLKND